MTNKHRRDGISRRSALRQLGVSLSALTHDQRPAAEIAQEPATTPKLPAPLRRRIHAETHDVYLRDEAPRDDLVDACTALY